MKLFIRSAHFYLIIVWVLSVSAQSKNYTQYHQQVLAIEQLISQDQYESALDSYDQLFEHYDFVFLKEYKIAAQIAAHLGDEYRAFDYLGLGVANGWTLDEIKDHELLKRLKKNPRWIDLEFNYESLRLDYLYRINDSLRSVVKELFKEDQKMAFSYLFKPSEKAKNKFIEEKAVNISEKHLNQLNEIIDLHGYPGEKLIGNSVWSSTILSHHNSLSPEYQQQDQLYPAIRPKLLAAIDNGQLNPYHFAIIEDWYITVKSDRKEHSYGIIHPLKKANLEHADQLRANIHIRSIELRNALIDIEAKTGIDLNLGYGSWLQGKINPID
ncbi:hypothetical protein [Marinoscillum pacificum]|uniref:hypothetical protein n=1 Tax=Marinoscillum pacificum TaxID=392723 RepID=UPI002157E95E|nr:hypothetical protein [Marinoscillum pacificum]